MQKFVQEIYDLIPWYHDFRTLGIQTNFPSKRKFYFWGPVTLQNRENMSQQKRKEAVISPYIKTACSRFARTSNLSCLDLFCADGYYGFLTQKFCPEIALTGVDRNKADIARCKAMAAHLKLGPSVFVEDDVYHFVENTDKFDLVLCTGGLYHLTDPKRLLEGLRKITRQYMVVQSAITVEHDDPDYFESPNPWFKTWGSLFTNRYLLRLLNETGFEVLETTVNSRSNPNPDYVGATYALVR